MGIADLYKQWLDEGAQGSFIMYYNLNENRWWDRLNKQRNYKRNKDIIYRDSNHVRADLKVQYKLMAVNDGDFVFDDKFLLYKYDTENYANNASYEYIRPFTYAKMNVNDELKLEVTVPMLVDDVEFEIKNGCLIIDYE